MKLSNPVLKHIFLFKSGKISSFNKHTVVCDNSFRLSLISAQRNTNTQCFLEMSPANCASITTKALSDNTAYFMYTTKPIYYRR